MPFLYRPAPSELHDEAAAPSVIAAYIVKRNSLFLLCISRRFLHFTILDLKLFLIRSQNCWALSVSVICSLSASGVEDKIFFLDQIFLFQTRRCNELDIFIIILGETVLF